MGFILYDQSTTFTPADFGLKAGDTVHVICVGGGGGGCHTSTDNSHTIQYGGNGGSSNFGDYITALGGYGGEYRRSVALQTRYKNQQTPTEYMSAGGEYSGGGGWYPKTTRTAGDSINIIRSEQQYYLNNVTYYNTTIAVKHSLSTTGGSGPISRYESSNYRSLIFDTPQISPFDIWNITIRTFTQSSQLYYGIIMMPIVNIGAANCAYGNYQLYQTFSTGWVYNTSIYNIYNNSTHQYFTHFRNGGMGYGAGGGGLYSSGCGGEVREANVRLESNAPITIGVGGGGSGGMAYTSNGSTYYYVQGVDGTTGAAGQPSTSEQYYSWACPGGYGKHIPKPSSVCQSLTSNSQEYYMSGGGASGCVAIWW